MASLILGAVGSAIGSSIFGTGILGITGAQIGGALGTIIGSEIDAAIAPGRNVRRTGPRLTDIQIQSSSEGTAIPRVYGRVRAAGQLLWATRFKETAVTTRTRTGGGKGIAAKTTVTDTEYKYAVSFAVGLCEGVITKLGRVWADGALIDLTQFTTRLYTGSEAQAPDPLIEETEGAGNTPAYRGLAYIVFEDMPLESFGNRIPQLSFEIIRALSDADPSALENVIPGVCLIPGAGEFVYSDTAVTADNGEGTTTPVNTHSSATTPDIDASLDELQALAPNFSAVSLVVGWFGSDLRCAECQIKPGVEAAVKMTYPETWSVNGVARNVAHVVSAIDGRPAYGGTPSDASVIAAIRNLKARGLRVLFNPFLFLDIASGNTLPDPYTGTPGQPAYPWRGRIVCDPAPGISGSPDKTSTAATQVSAFFGAAAPSDFAIVGETVAWSGGDEWSYRRMVLHYAHLCAGAGGVDAFLIGSELVGLARVRDGATTYPAVAALRALAADVRGILGPVAKLGYAADWSEYNNHQTNDAPGAVLFNLDPLWSDTNIDFIGIDNYMPLADWRDGTAHADYDAANGPTAIHDIAYLKSNIAGGEGYDWYYASDGDRDAQIRTPITDGLGKPWVFRAKDIVGWWSNAHFDRADGTESTTPTGWVPQSKQVIFTELGCPAIDKGANQPNVFFDPKSSESAVPYYSNGQRDDLIQRRFLEAHLAYWSDPANNPISADYDAPMLATDIIYVWTWDARPFPAFPSLSAVWGDAPNYQYGHWLNGRLGSVQLADLVTSLCLDASVTDADAAALSGLVTGYAVTNTMSPRDAIQPLALAFHFDGLESEGQIRFVMRGRATAAGLSLNDLALVDGEEGFGFTLTRAQETDLPLASRIAYIDVDADYRQAMVDSRRLVARSDRVATSQLPIVMDQGQATGIAARLLQDAWETRETAAFALPPSRLALDPADETMLDTGERTHRLRLLEVNDANERSIRAEATDPSIYEPLTGPQRAPGAGAMIAQYGRPVVTFLDLPLLTGRENAWSPHVAAFANPWPGAELIFRSFADANFTLDTTLTAPASLGVTTSDFASGPLWRWDRMNALTIRLFNGALSSLDDLSVLAGGNTLALENADGGWEVLQFANAELTAPDQWRLTKLLRGQAGTESAVRDSIAAGARVVILDGALAQLHLTEAERNLPFNVRYGPQGRALSDPAYQSASLQFEGIGLRPYAPTHLRVQSSGSDLVLSWVRRDRNPASDSWDQTEIPLSETSETYDIEIRDGSTVVRTFSSVSSSTVTYTAGMIAADFPSGLGSLDCSVYQRSTVFGRGCAGSLIS